MSKTYDGMPIACMFVDSGYRPGDKWARPTNQIYAFCRRHQGRAWPTKGHDHLDKPLKPSRIDITLDGRVIKDGVELWHVDTDFFKSWLHARFAWPIDQPGRWLVHEGASDDYWKHLVSEVRVAVGTQSRWLVLKQANHMLDAEVLCVAAAYRMNLHIAMPDFRVGSIGPVSTGAPPRRRIISKGVA